MATRRFHIVRCPTQKDRVEVRQRIEKLSGELGRRFVVPPDDPVGDGIGPLKWLQEHRDNKTGPYESDGSQVVLFWPLPAELSGAKFVLKRFNMARDTFLRELPGVLVMVGSGGLLSWTPSEAPDLWSVAQSHDFRSYEAPPDALRRALEQRRAVLFVGAGLSMRAGLPGWKELLAPLRVDLASAGVKTPPDDPLLLAEYYEAAVSRNDLVRLVRDEILLSGARPTPLHRRLVRLPWHCIVTTNFDRLLEAALEEEEIPHLPIYPGPGVAYSRGDRISLYKIHGDVFTPDSVVITKQDYREYANKYASMITFLKGLLVDKTFFFLGYGMNDPDVESIWDAVHVDLSDAANLSYAVMRSPSEVDRKLHKNRKVELVSVSAWEDDLPAFVADLGRRLGQEAMEEDPGAPTAGAPAALSSAAGIPTTAPAATASGAGVPTSAAGATHGGEGGAGAAGATHGGEGGAGAAGATHGGEVGAGQGAARNAKSGIHADSVVARDAGSGAAVAALRRAYLNHLYETAGRLNLSGVDRKMMGPTDRPLHLESVYTALMTTTVEALMTTTVEAPELHDERSAASAVEQLDRYARLVLLGDPGSGKSTFSNFVALCMAGEILGDKPLNLETLTAPLPAEAAESDREPEHREANAQPRRQPWHHGVLLPVRVQLRDLAATGLPPPGRRATANHVLDFIRSELASIGLAEFHQPLRRELLEKGGIIFFDGLDEVPDAEGKRERIKAAVEDCAAVHPACRIVVTSRTYAYQNQQWQLQRFASTALAPFGRGQIDRFISLWYLTYARLRGLSREDAEGRCRRLQDVVSRTKALFALAQRPLLLTLIASLHAWRGGSLPAQRAELYEDAVELLFDWWEGAKVRFDSSGNAVVQQESLAELLRVGKKEVREWLDRLGFDAHSKETATGATADIAETDLLHGLLSVCKGQCPNPHQIMSYVSDRAGLLVQRGVGVYTFPHRTFQEFLAACFLSREDFPNKLADLVGKAPERWREVALLAGARAGGVAPYALWGLVDALVPAAMAVAPPESSPSAIDRLAALGAVHRPSTIVHRPFETGRHFQALVAGQALVEGGIPGKLNAVARLDVPKLDRVRHGLLEVLRAEAMPAVERAAAGGVLAALGDPRFDPGSWHLPKGDTAGFLKVPAGGFLMGSDKKKDGDAHEGELKQHLVDLPEFWVSRYPVTVAQFKAFVEDSPEFKPGDSGFQKAPDNHPVVRVSWEEARAYCRWLDGKLKGKATDKLRGGVRLVPPSPGNLDGGGTEASSDAVAFWGGLVEGKVFVTLPSEGEWEKASRGTDGRIFPWGDDADPNKANYGSTGLGRVCAVGCFPGGAGLFGAEDMSGNVWEWTRSPYGKYPFKPDYRRRATVGDVKGGVVVRGGSYWFNLGNVRCAFRNRYNPEGRLDNIGFRVVVSPFLP